MQLINDKKVKNRYIATMMIATRAKEIVDGAAPLTEDQEMNPVSQAIKEFENGLFNYKIKERENK